MMNQSYVVPSWDDIIIDEQNPAAALSSSSKPNHLLPTVDYEVAELTWKDGHLGMHAFGLPKLLSKPKEDNIYTLALASSSLPERCCWDKPLAAGGTLESIVNQATTTTTIPLSKSATGVGIAAVAGAGGEQLVTSWFDGQPIPQSLPVNAMSCLVGSCTLVGSCSVTPTLMEEGKQATHDWGSRAEQSIRGSGTAGTILGSEYRHGSEQDTCDTGGFTINTSASLGSAGNTTSSAKNTVDDHDSVCHSRNQGGDDDKEEEKKRVTVLGKRSRCAAVHNQSERKRRDKINQRMSILQKLVPNSSKTDKASMLDEVIEYMKQLQNKVDMMSRMNMSTMMLPLALQQQLQMSFMSSPSAMGAGMGLNLMDINHPMTTRQPGMPTPPHGFYSNPFMPTTMASWGHNRPESTSMPTTDIPTFSAPSFLPSHSHSQPSMTMDAYSRMAAMYHQLQVPPAATATPASDIKGRI